MEKANSSINSSSNPTNTTMKLPPLSSLQWLQGSAPPSFSTTAAISGGQSNHKEQLHLGLLFQPNCPGCLRYAVPTANQLYQQQQENEDNDNRVYMYAISTAFEDFEFNTLENTQLLLDEGRLVGDSQRQLGGSTTTTGVPRVPVAMDIVVPQADASAALLETAVQATRASVATHLQGMLLQQQQQQQQSCNNGASSCPAPLPTIAAKMEEIMGRMDFRAILPERIATIFFAVRAQGTPTWILSRSTSNEEAERVLGVKFGHFSVEELLEWIKEENEKINTYDK